MLGKLIKHEFRATARIMLPVLAAVIVLGVLLGLSVLGQQSSDLGALSIFLGLLIMLMIISIVAAAVLSVVLMVYRFYRNLLGNEGYMMFSLPVSVDAQVWSKMIVSSVWFLATGFAIMVAILTAVGIMGFSDLKVIFENLPTWEEFRKLLMEVGLQPVDLAIFALEFIVATLVSGLVTCLHFYASMSLGQMFSVHRGLYSVLFFFGISIAFQMIFSVVQISGFSVLATIESLGEGTMRQALGVFHRLVWGETGMGVIEGVILYLITTFTLKKRLNLA